MMTLVDGLVVASPLFAELWRHQDVHGCCRGKRSFIVVGAGYNSPNCEEGFAGLQLPELRAPWCFK